MSVESIALVLNHSAATGNDRLVLIGVANHDGDGGSWPTVRTLGRYANVSRRTVQRCLRNLEALGELTVEYNDGGTHRTPKDERPNRYSITLKGGGVTADAPSEKGASERTEGGVTVDTGGASLLSPEPSYNHPEPSVTPGAAAPTLMFDRFWKAYPRHIGKAAALRKWLTLIKTVDPTVIVAGAERMAADPNLPAERFIPHPVTWLNQGRWDDDPYPLLEHDPRAAAAYTPEEAAGRKAPVADPPPALDDDPTGGARWQRFYRERFAAGDAPADAIRRANIALGLTHDGLRKATG